jgi:hypothetical protein
LVACAVAAPLACTLLIPSIARAAAPTASTDATALAATTDVAPPALSVRAAALV